MTAGMGKANAGRGILSVWNNYDPAKEEFYERWYTMEHFPERLSVPGFLRARRFAAIDADRQYFTFYDLESPDVLFSETYVNQLNSPTEWTRRVMEGWTAMFRTVCERVVRTGDALGGYAIVARLEAPTHLNALLADDIIGRLDDTSVVAVDVWRATERQNDGSIESSNRAEPDRTISGAVIVEATNARKFQSHIAQLDALLRPMTSKPPVIGTYRLIALQSVNG
jgi:hypothetical protein